MNRATTSITVIIERPAGGVDFYTIRCSGHNTCPGPIPVSLPNPSRRNEMRLSVADPGFSRGGGANFSQKLHEIERIWTPGWARVPRAPLRSATGYIINAIHFLAIHNIIYSLRSISFAFRTWFYFFYPVNFIVCISMERIWRIACKYYNLEGTY